MHSPFRGRSTFPRWPVFGRAHGGADFVLRLGSAKAKVIPNRIADIASPAQGPYRRRSTRAWRPDKSHRARPAARAACRRPPPSKPKTRLEIQRRAQPRLFFAHPPQKKPEQHAIDDAYRRPPSEQYRVQKRASGKGKRPPPSG